MPTKESILVLWFQSLTCLPLAHDVKSCTARNNSTYWTDNPSIGHICICIHDKNFQIRFFTLLMSHVLFICIWYWDDQFWSRVNGYFGHILATLVCQENVELSIGHKSIWKLHWSKIVNAHKDGTQTTLPVSWQRKGAYHNYLELPFKIGNLKARLIAKPAKKTVVALSI